MAAISDYEAYAKGNANPFFTRAQLFAFSKPPAAEALKTVNRGGSHDYLPHEYIRELLNRLIGPGLWEVKAVVHSTDKEVVKKSGKDQIAATAIVNVELSVFSKQDPSLRITYSAVGSHTMYAGVEQGFGSVIGNAIDSAESDGIKAAAKNLGRAFGFDLKGKLDRKVLPPNLHEYEQILAGIYEKNPPKDLSAPAQPAADPAIAEATPAPAPVAEVAQEAAQAEDAAEAPEAVSATDTAAAAPVAENKPKTEAKPKTAPAPKQEAAPEAQAPSPQAAAEAASQEEAPATGQWELSMDPGSDFNNWVACLTTMKDRVEAMTSAREIESFVKRYAKRIKDLPIIEDKDFKDRWRKIVARKYFNLGLDIPDAYRAPAAATA
jgi:hypothetical protein